MRRCSYARAMALSSRSEVTLDRWHGQILVLLTVLVALLFGAATASAAAPPAAETRVGAITPTVTTVVGVHECITAGQRPVRGPSQLQMAVGNCVAAEAGTDAASAARGGVYSLRDEVGNVVRTGRGKDLAARERAHFNDPELGDYRFNVEYRTDVYAEQRGLEQLLYDRYPGAQASNGGFNKIRGISPTNPNGAGYMQSAWGFLERLGGR